MADIGQMNYFKVKQCGLYKINATDPSGCDLNETFDLIRKWALNRPMCQTLPWDAMRTSSKSRCYLRDIYKDESTGDFVIVLWKSNTNKSGSIWGAEEDSMLGTSKIIEFNKKHRGKTVIWGQPCYYWIIPNLKSVMSVKFDHSVCDSQLFQEYVAACINNRVDHPNRKKEYTDKGFTRISYTDREDLNRYAFRFDMSLRSLNTSNAELAKLAQDVTHIVKRETIVVNVKDERAKWVKILDNVPFVPAKPKSNFRHIEVKIDAKPTAEDLKQIIEQYATEYRKPGNWDNVGFQAENKLIWANTYRLTDELIITNKPPGVIPAAYLYNELEKKRNQFIEPIIKSIEEESNIKNMPLKPKKEMGKAA